VAEQTPAETLLIVPGSAGWMSHPERIVLLEPWPNDTSQVGDVAKAQVALVFADDDGRLRAGLQRVTRGTAGALAVWIVHRGTPGADTRYRLTPYLDEYGLTGGDHLKVDAVWSALRVTTPDAA
jgi:hypothetical protein